MLLNIIIVLFISAAISIKAHSFGIEIDVSKRDVNSIWAKIQYVAPTKYIQQFLPKLGQPVHEMITNAALIENNIQNQLEKQEVRNGVIFNDDPDGLLLPYDRKYNPKGYQHSHRGTNWLTTFGKVATKQYYVSLVKSLKTKLKELRDKYRFGNLSLMTLYTTRLSTASAALISLEAEFKLNKNMLNDSHFDQLQFLHSMSSGDKSRDEVKSAIMTYMDYAWKLAAGEITYDSHISSIREIKSRNNPENKVEAFILKYPTTDLAYHSSDDFVLRHRALGSILHLVQDSYAKGHTVRESWEAESGFQVNSGKIRYFQDYSQQDGHKHSEHDTNEVNESDWKSIPGAMAAFKQSRKLIEFFKLNCSFENEFRIDDRNCPRNGVKSYLDQVVFGLVEYKDKSKNIIEYKSLGKFDTSNTKSHRSLRKGELTLD